MPEIKIKHVVSFSSEDTVYKAENLLKPETYRKWKCATAGEKNATVILQFEKASQIQSIDIGNEHSAFVEILVGRSANTTNDYEAILVSSSFMSPLESRNGNNSNRVRMFTSDKLVHNVKNEKWDQVQIVCTQPFNKTIQYGLSFIKFHSPEDPKESTSNEKKNELKLGAFKLKENDDDEDPLPVGKWFSKRNEKPTLPATGPVAIRQASSFASAVLENNSPPDISRKSPKLKLKLDDKEKTSPVPLKKKEQLVTHVNREKVGYKNISKLDSDTEEEEEEKLNVKTPNRQKTVSPRKRKLSLDKPQVQGKKKKKKKDFQSLMENVVFVISGFQNPLRSTIRDQALEMGAKYKGDWDSSCTHLVCAFINTPKYITVRARGGRIISKEWIFECHKKKELLPWRKYMLGDYSKSTTEEESEEEENISPISKTNHLNSKRLSPKTNGTLTSPSTSKAQNLPSTSKAADNMDDNDETLVDDEDETDAEGDYKADTDVDSSSAGDTEDELRKVEEKNKRLSKISPKKSPVKKELNEDLKPKSSLLSPVKITKQEELMTDKLPLPILPNYFKGKKFFLYGKFDEEEHYVLQRYITAYNGNLLEYMSPDVKYVITSSKWNQDFDEALSENEDLTFVRPQWIHQCHEKEKCVPFQPYIIIPDS